MKKKLFAALVLALVVSTASVFAFGIGIQGGYDPNLDGGPGSGNVAITFKVDKSPLVFATDFGFHKGYSTIGLTGDYWISNANLAGPVNYFYGVGFGASIKIVDGAEDSVNFGAALRVPVGINMFFAKGVIEPYLQLVPQLVLPLPSFDLDPALGCNVGIRFWF